MCKQCVDQVLFFSPIEAMYKASLSSAICPQDLKFMESKDSLENHWRMFISQEVCFIWRH